MPTVHNGSTIPLDASTLFVVATCVMTLLGLILGSVTGVRGLEWLGRKIRDRENS